MATSARLASRPAALALPVETPWWVLRFGAALCFIGHGAFGFITKAAWLPYFGVVGIPAGPAWQIMPWVGAIDVTAGMAVLFAPRPLPLIYMAGWALWTAALRPLAGESVFEALERAGNYGVPAALLLWNGVPRSWRALFDRLHTGVEAPGAALTVRRVLQWTTCLLLAGHGALGAFTGKALLTQQYAAIGLGAGTTPLVGWFELILAVAVLVRPGVALLLFIAGWKLATESLYLATGAPIWEFVERTGSYAAPLALAAIIWRERLTLRGGPP